METHFALLQCSVALGGHRQSVSTEEIRDWVSLTLLFKAKNRAVKKIKPEGRNALKTERGRKWEEVKRE